MQKNTIDTFPNELLSKVFIEAAAENPETSCLSRQLVPKKHNSGYIFVHPALWLRSRTNVALSHVCRLFRTIAIDTPELWANVSNLQTKEELDVYLQRSKQVGLGIHLLIDDPKYNFKDFDANVRAVAVPRDFMNAVLPLAHRWVGFEFKTGKWMHFFMNGVPKDLSALCKGLKLPRLRSLSLSYPSPRYFDEGLGLTELEQSEKGLTRDFRFYETWFTPDLKHLNTTWHVPKATPGTTSLQSLSINLGSATYHHTWDDRPLMTLRPLFTSLQRLSLRVGETIWNEVRDKKPRLELPSLEVFVLHTQTMDCFLTELQCLIMPNLKSMQVECRPVDTNLSGDEKPESEEQYIIHKWILQLFNKENDFQHLESLRLSFWTVGKYCDYYAVKCTSFQHIFSAIFERFPNLHRLFFEAPFGIVKLKGGRSKKGPRRNKNRNDREPKSLADVKVAPLRTLTFQNCPSLPAEDIVEVLGELKKGSDWDRFEIMNVNWCSSTKKSSIESIIPKSNFCWRESPPNVDEDVPELTKPVADPDQHANEDSVKDDHPFSIGYYDSDTVSSAADLSDFDLDASTQ